VLRLVSELSVSMHEANVVRLLRIIGVSGWLLSCREFSRGPSSAELLAWCALVGTFAVWTPQRGRASRLWWKRDSGRRAGLARLTRRAG